MAWRRSCAHNMPFGVMAKFVQHVYNTTSFYRTAVCRGSYQFRSSLTQHSIVRCSRTKIDDLIATWLSRLPSMSQCLTYKFPPLQPRLARDLLRATLQMGVRVANRPRNSVESKARRLSRELDLSANMEESKVSGHQMMRHTSRLVLKSKPISTNHTRRNRGREQHT